MRSHRDIVAAVDPEKLAPLCGVSFHTAKSWGQRDGIPAEYWLTIVNAQHSTLAELAAGAAANPRKRPTEQAAA